MESLTPLRFTYHRAMDSLGICKDLAAKIRHHSEASVTAARALSEEKLNTPVDGQWSVAMVLEHMNVSHGAYLETLQKLVPTLGPASGPAKTTFMGRKVCKFAGPNGNAPVPSKAMPAVQTYGPEVIDRFSQIQREFADLVEASAGKDINVKIPSPLMSFLKFTLADVYMITEAHTDHHTRQIIDRAARA